MDLLELVKESTIEGETENEQGLIEVDEDIDGMDIEGIVDSKVEAKVFLCKASWSGLYEDTWQPPRRLDCYGLVNTFHTSNPGKPKPEARGLQRVIREDYS